MSVRAAPHELAEQPFVGAPVVLPRVLLCHATERYCGRSWLAATWPQYDEKVKQRQVHELLCANRAQLVTA